MSKRSEKMKRRSMAELIQMAESGSLSAAAAEYEIARRKKRDARDADGYPIVAED